MLVQTLLHIIYIYAFSLISFLFFLLSPFTSYPTMFVRGTYTHAHITYISDFYIKHSNIYYFLFIRSFSFHVHRVYENGQMVFFLSSTNIPAGRLFTSAARAVYTYKL